MKSRHTEKKVTCIWTNVALLYSCAKSILGQGITVKTTKKSIKIFIYL